MHICVSLIRAWETVFYRPVSYTHLAMTDWKAAVRSWARMEHNPDLKNQNDKKGDSPEGNPYYVEGAIML